MTTPERSTEVPRMNAGQIEGRVESDCLGRPDFATPSEYLEDCEIAVQEGRPPWRPVERRELIALAHNRPDLFARFRPTSRDLRGMGLPDVLGREAEPMSSFQIESFLKRLMIDSDVSAALRFVLSENRELSGRSD